MYVFIVFVFPIKTKIFSFVHTILFSLAEICFFSAIDAVPATSIVGTDFLDKNLFVSPESNPSKSPAKRFVKQLSSKWAEHKNIFLEYCAGSKSERCRQNKANPFLSNNGIFRDTMHCYSRSVSSVCTRCLVRTSSNTISVTTSLFIQI